VIEAVGAQDVDLLARVAKKIAQIMADLGSANEIIAPDLQRQLAGTNAPTPKSKAEKSPIGRCWPVAAMPARS